MTLMKTFRIAELAESAELWTSAKGREFGGRIIEQSTESDEVCLDFEGLSLMSFSGAYGLFTPLSERRKGKGRGTSYVARNVGPLVIENLQVALDQLRFPLQLIHADGTQTLLGCPLRPPAPSRAKTRRRGKSPDSPDGCGSA